MAFQDPSRYRPHGRTGGGLYEEVTASIPVGVQPESVMLTPSERTLVVSLRGTPASLAFADTTMLALVRTVQIGGPGTAGDLAVMTPDGRYVYATFDAGATGTGGVAVVHVPTGKVVATWPLPDHRASARDLVLEEAGAVLIVERQPLAEQ